MPSTLTASKNRPNQARVASCIRRGAWTDVDRFGRVWLCWTRPSGDPHETWLEKTVIGVPERPATL